MESLVEIKNIEKYYYNKKVFITGHTGFKGSWLIFWLKKLGAQVKGYSLKPEKNSLYNYLDGDSIIDHSEISDINDFNNLKKSIIDFQPDYIFHLAAQALVRKSYDETLNTFNTNIIGTANILNSLKSLNKKCSIIIITTDKVYENLEWNYPYRENDKLGGYDPYSSSKAAAELIVNSYRKSFFNFKNYNSHQKNISSVRAGNVIGGGDWSEDRLFADLAKSFSKNQPLLVRNPDSIRPWQHVLEPLSAYLLIGAKSYNMPMKYSKAWNIGPYNSSNLSVKDVIEISIKYWEKSKAVFQHKKDNQFHEAKILKLDISNALNLLKWKPVLEIKDSVRMTVQWYKKFYDGKNCNKLMEDDIKFYLNNL